MKIFDQRFELIREGRYLCLGCRSEFNRADAIRHLRNRRCPEASMPAPPRSASDEFILEFLDRVRDGVVGNTCQLRLEKLAEKTSHDIHDFYVLEISLLRRRS